MKPIKHWLTLAFALISISLHADARKGELFAYKIGDRYSVSNSTTGRLHWLGMSLEVFAEKSNKPTNMGDVVVTTTLATHTIVGIRSETYFKDYDQARQFVLSYSELLRARYQFKSWDDEDAALSELFGLPGSVRDKNQIRLSADLNADYRLRIFLAAPRREDMTWEEFSKRVGVPLPPKTNTVDHPSLSPKTPSPEPQLHMVEISLVPIGSLHTDLLKQVDNEYNALLVEGAKKKKLLDGL